MTSKVEKVKKTQKKKHTFTHQLTTKHNFQMASWLFSITAKET